MQRHSQRGGALFAALIATTFAAGLSWAAVSLTSTQ